MARQHEDPAEVMETNYMKTSGYWLYDFLQPHSTVGCSPEQVESWISDDANGVLQVGEGHQESFSSFSLKVTEYGLTKEFNEILMGYVPQC